MKKVGSGRTSYTANRIIQDLWATFYAFDYKRFYEIKKSADMRNSEIAETIKRIESHPTWNKPLSEHLVLTEQRERREKASYQKELELDALHGQHHKHANVFFGKVLFDPEYQEVCKRLGIVLVLNQK